MKRMLLMRVILSLSFCFALCSAGELKTNHLESLRFARQNGQSSSAIRQIANDFSLLARLVNGISLQEGLSDGSTNLDDVIAEFLNIESSNTVRDLLQMQLDTNEISSKLEKMLKDVGKLGDNPLTDSALVRDAIVTLDTFKNDIVELKAGKKKDIAKDFIEKAKKLNTIDDIQMPYSDFAAIASHLKAMRFLEPDINNADALAESRSAIKRIAANSTSFYQTLGQFRSYKTLSTLGKIWAINNNYTVLNSIFKISKAAQAYNQNYAILSSLSSKMRQLQDDSTKLISLASQNDFHSTLSISLKPFATLVAGLSTLRVSDRSFTEGFPNGPSDLSKIKDDLKGAWLKEKIAEGKDMTILSSSFQTLEKFTEKLIAISEDWTKFRNANGNTKLVTDSSSVFEGLAEDGKVLSVSNDLESSIKSLTKTIKDLKKIETSPELENFDKLYNYVFRINEYAEKFKKAFEQMETIGMSEVADAWTEVETIANGAVTSTDATVIIDAVKKMRAVENQDKLAKVAIIASDELKSLLSGEFSSFLKDKPKWDVVEGVQQCLEGTGFVEALENLNSATISLNTIDRMLDYGTKVRQIDKTSVESLKSIIVVLGKLRDGIKQVKDPFGKSSRHRRAPGGKLKTLKKSKVIASDLGKGVNLLHGIAKAYDRRNELITAAELPDAVNTAVSLVPSLESVWTVNNRKALKEMPAELEKLEQYAQENKDKTDLIELGSVFGRASEIKGSPIDSKLLKESVVPALEKNYQSNVKATAPTFLKLSELELDFSKHSTRIKAASLTLPSLREYFDEIFGIKRTQIAGESDEKKDEIQSGLSIEMLGIIVGCIILFLLLVGGIIFCIVRCRKRRQYNARLLDPETWVLLSFTAENTPNTFGSGFSIEAHKHIIKKNYDSFKKCLKNGAYVDAKLQTDKQSNTMLHEAVLHDKHKYVEALIKHGATREILNHEFETPMQLAVRLKKKKCIKMFKKYEHKKFQIVLPEVFTKNNYLIDVDRAIPIEEHYHGDFFKKFGQYQHEHPKRPTHYVAKTDKDNVLHVKDHHLPMIFSATMIMGHRWLKACLDNPSAIGNNKEWRVTKMSFRGKEYDTLLTIKDYINRMNVPYMFGIGVSYNNHTLAQEWSLMRTVTTQLGVYNGTGEFPFMCPKPGHCYHRDDLPRNFFLYHRNDKAQVQLNFKSTWMDNPAFCFMNTDDFTQFLLEFKIVSKKIEKIDKKNGVVKKKNEKKKGKDKLVSEESCSVTDCSESCASTMSVGTPVSRTPTSGTPNSRTPNSVTPTSRTPGKTRRH